MKVLIIEDSMVVKEMLQDSLLESGYQVSVASDGDEGLQLYRENKPDLIIVDILLPKKGGVNIILEVRKENQKVKIIAMSGSVRGPGHAEDILEIGADRFIEKSFDLCGIVESADELLSAESLQRTKFNSSKIFSSHQENVK